MKVLRRPDLILLSLVVAHVLLGVSRVPGVVYARRFDDIDDYRDRGAAAFHLDTPQLQGAEAVRWILDNVPPEAVVLWRGDYKGAFEFAAPLLAPRLLVEERWCGDEAVHYLERPVASGTLPDGSRGIVVLVAEGSDLTLEVR